MQASLMVLGLRLARGSIQCMHPVHVGLALDMLKSKGKPMAFKTSGLLDMCLEMPKPVQPHALH